MDAPAWAEALKLEGYYSDFSLQLEVEPQVVVAGRVASTRSTVASLGPSAASDVVLTLREDADIGLQTDGACSRTGFQTVRCRLGALQPGQELQTLQLPLLSDPDARGLRLLSGYVDSENPATADGPALHIDATWLSLVGEFDIGVRLLDDVPVLLPDDHLQWTVELDNRGPSSLIDGYLVLSTSNSARTQCLVHGNAACPDSIGRVYLAPGSRVELQVEIPRSELEGSPINFAVGALAMEGVRIGSRPMFVSLQYASSLYRNGFEN
ncbi:hypothetical protein [Aquimonas voraii]|uniref:Uncharacterized protein n=1 Tax=Aquimonas voraii TaxID=265719 RepID=A0A1G6V0N1_9GAMM|nr:hypothetical protein [Aquimonas voraii]SDD47169.1 hypothetical protein SAMN04488509_102588 [Aquimonas voraii]